jgi:TusA-related sulfurtransferase
MKVIDSDDICPVLMIKLLRLWNEVVNDEEVIIKTPWEAVVEEVKKWCEYTGNEFLSADKIQGKYAIKIILHKK